MCNLKFPGGFVNGIMHFFLPLFRPLLLRPRQRGNRRIRANFRSTQRETEFGADFVGRSFKHSGVYDLQVSAGDGVAIPFQVEGAFEPRPSGSKIPQLDVMQAEVRGDDVAVWVQLLRSPKIGR